MIETSLFSSAWVPALMFGAAMIIAIPGVLSFLRNQRAQSDVERRLERSGRRQDDDGQEDNRNQSRIGKAVQGFGANATPDDEGEVSAVRALLIQAGFPNQSAVGRYYFARLVCVVVPQVVLLFSLPYLSQFPPITPLASCLFLVILGLALPTMWLNHRISQRKSACSAGFPDMMDLLVACVEAGLSLDASVQRVGEELVTRHPIIATHMKTLSLELRAGKPRKTAWRSFADRMALEEAGSLATMLRQAEEMGTSLGQTLRIFSADMRQKRILYAEEKAMALPAKMTLPLILFVFPVLLGVLIVPAAVTLANILP